MAVGDQPQEVLVPGGLRRLGEHLPVEGVTGGGQVQIARAAAAVAVHSRVLPSRWLVRMPAWARTARV